MNIKRLPHLKRKNIIQAMQGISLAVHSTENAVRTALHIYRDVRNKYGNDGHCLKQYDARVAEITKNYGRDSLPLRV